MRFCRMIVPAVLFATMVSTQAWSQARLNSAVLPSGRSVQVAMPASAFLTVVNAASGDDTTGCALVLEGITGGSFEYFATDADNEPVGDANPVFDLAAGNAASFVFSYSRNQAADPVDIYPVVNCGNGSSARIRGVNSFVFSASATPVPDIIPIAVTLSGDGVVRSADTGRRQALALAAVNFGAGDPTNPPQIPPSAEANIRVVPVWGGLPLPASLLVCETDTQSNCIAPLSESVWSMIGSTPRTFKVIVDPDDQAGIPLFPDIVRVAVEFRDQSGVVRGSTSVALTAPPPQWPFPWNATNWPSHSASNGIGSTARGNWIGYFEPSDGAPYVGPVFGNGASIGGELWQSIFVPFRHLTDSDGIDIAVDQTLRVVEPAGQGSPAQMAYINTPGAGANAFTGEYLLNSYLILRARHPSGATTRIRAVWSPANANGISPAEVEGNYAVNLPSGVTSGGSATFTRQTSNGGFPVRNFNGIGSVRVPTSFLQSTSPVDTAFLTGTFDMMRMDGRDNDGPYLLYTEYNQLGNFGVADLFFFKPADGRSEFSFITGAERRWVGAFLQEYNWIEGTPQ